MKCENCAHKSVCIDGMNFKMLKECEECAEFKDQSKFIELPCEVGDILYKKDYLGGKIREYKVIAISVERRC